MSEIFFDINSNEQSPTSNKQDKNNLKNKKQKKGVGKSKQFVNDVKMKGNSNW